jgi:hypothetical protein
MVLANSNRPLLGRKQFWLLSNYGNPWSIHRTYKEAKAEAMTAHGPDCRWDDIREWFEIRKITLTEGWRNSASG